MTKQMTTETCNAVSDDVTYRRQLIAEAKAGDKRAFEQYYKLNEGLFKSTLNRYRKWVSPEQVDDLRQEGMLGLMRGIEKYDTTKATDKKPEGYVFSWVRAYISQYARDNGVASTKGMISENYVVAEEDEDSISLFDCIKDENEDVAYEAVNRQIHGIMNDAVRKLLPKEKIIARRRLLSDEPETLEAIGEDLGVSRERIRQIETEVREKLKKRLSRKLRELYDEHGTKIVTAAAILLVAGGVTMLYREPASPEEMTAQLLEPVMAEVLTDPVVEEPVEAPAPVVLAKLPNYTKPKAYTRPRTPPKKAYAIATPKNTLKQEVAHKTWLQRLGGKLHEVVTRPVDDSAVAAEWGSNVTNDE